MEEINQVAAQAAGTAGFNETTLRSTLRTIATRAHATRDYAEMGVLEYWRLDPTDDSLMDPPLAADRLAGGRYERVRLNTETSGMIWSHSDQLGLDLCWDGNQLRIYNPAAREYLKNRAEEQTARQAAEARVAELEEKLERRRQP